MLNSAQREDRATEATCWEKVNWSSITTPKFLTTWEGTWVIKSWFWQRCWAVWFVWPRKPALLFLERLSWKWCSLIHVDMSARQSEIHKSKICQINDWHLIWTSDLTRIVWIIFLLCVVCCVFIFYYLDHPPFVSRKIISWLYNIRKPPTTLGLDRACFPYLYVEWSRWK